MNFELVNVAKSYDKPVLNGLTVDIKDKQAIAIIGASGCGKSTLLRLISGMEQADSGDIKVNDVTLSGQTINEYQENLGFVFQKHNLFPHLTLKENITLILSKVKKQPKEQSEKKANELLATLRLTEQANKLPKNVSGGQAQRAAIARALSTDPELLLLDEPTASLDPILTHEVLEAITLLKKMGKDFFFVTHEMAFVRKFADYFIFIDNGEIVEHGEIAALTEPKTEQLITFLEKSK